MKKLSAALVAAVLALAGASAFAADPPKADAAAMKAAVKLKKPADMTQEAWDKLSDADKKKAVDKAALAAKSAAAAEPGKKVKKGGC